MSSDPFGVCLEENCEDKLEMPPTTDMAKNLFDSAKGIIGGVLNGEQVFVSEEEKARRLEICGACEFFEKVKSRCSKCGCYMETKAKFNSVKCPIDKW